MRRSDAAATARPTRPRTRPAEAPAPAGADVVDEPDGSPLFPLLEVTVRHADGSPPTGCSAFALLPGDAAADPVARVELARDGAGSLRLPAPGVYDVGATTGDSLVRTIVAGVDARTTSRVELTMPATAEIRIELDPSIPKGTHATQHLLLLDAPSTRITFNSVDLPTTFRVPPGTRVRLQQSGEPFRCVPDLVTAPGAVVVRRDERGRFRIRLSATPDRAARHDASLRITEFDVEGGGTVDRWDDFCGDYDVGAGARVFDSLKHLDGYVQRVPAPHATLRWRGVGIAAGSVEIDAPDGVTVDVPVVLRLDETLPGEGEAVLRIDGAAGAAPPRYYFVAADDDETWKDRDDAAVGAEFVVGLPPWRGLHVVAEAEGLASDPAPVEAGARRVLHLRPAGRVRVFRGVAPPDGVELRLRRKDGGLLTIRDDDAESAVQGTVRRARLEAPSMVFGPLPEGDVTLVASCADVDLCEVRAHVVAGSTTDVRLPLADRLPAK